MEYTGYVDVEFYKDSFKGNIITDDVLEHSLIMASHDIDSLTYNRIRKFGFDNLTDFQQDVIKKSVCLHADFIFEYGDFLNLPITSYSAGMTSVSFQNGTVLELNGVTTNKSVHSMLKQSGLTVGVLL